VETCAFDLPNFPLDEVVDLFSGSATAFCFAMLEATKALWPSKRITEGVIPLSLRVRDDLRFYRKHQCGRLATEGTCPDSMPTALRVGAKQVSVNNSWVVQRTASCGTFITLRPNIMRVSIAQRTK
jgi:hypothetical protein